MKYFAICVILLFAINEAENARILGVFPIGAKSHYNLGRALMRGLAEKGHDITMISPYSEKDIPKNWKHTDVILTGFAEEREKDANAKNMFDMVNLNAIFFIIFMNYMGNRVTELTFNHTNVQKLLNSDAKFDVVIVEQFVNDAHKVFAHHYNCPLVLFGTFSSNAWMNPLVANPAPPSYVSETFINFSYQYFFDRVLNSFLYVFGELNRHLVFFPAQNIIMKKYFPNAPDLSELNYNASLVLLNSHVSTNVAVPRVPSIIDIGGYHVTPPKKLPKNLQDLLDNAKDGVIYFSMGSNLQSTHLPIEKRQAIIKSFAKLKQTVLWKWEEDDLPGKPVNVKTEKWLPQQDILAHPNVKAFITHCGLLSMIEAIYHGVPLIAIPIFGDQQMNALDAEKNGYAVTLSYKGLTEEKLTEKLDEVLNNPKYYKNAQKRSKIFHDRPNKPMDTAAYWIEYVIRHQGAPHLRVGGLDLAWYQYLLLDVVAFVLVVIIIILYIFCALIKYVLYCRNSSSVKDEKKKKL